MVARESLECFGWLLGHYWNVIGMLLGLRKVMAMNKSVVLFNSTVFLWLGVTQMNV